MNVVIEDLDDERPSDLTRDDLKTETELKLRQSGIAVENNPFLPYVYVQVGTLKLSNGLYAYTVNVKFKQLAKLYRDPNVIIFTTTWSVNFFGTSTNGTHLYEVVSHSMDKFLNAYLSVNPRGTGLSR